jgi:hypothetical protein
MYLHRRFAAVIAALLVFVFAGSTLASAATSVHKRGTTHTKKHHKKHRKHHKKHRRHHKKNRSHHKKHRRHHKKKRRHVAAAPVVPPAPAPAPAPPSTAGFTVGLVSGPAAGWEANMVSAAGLHPKVVRIPFSITDSASAVQADVAAVAAKGEQALLLAEFPGFIPTTQQAQNLASWAKAVGPGAAMWQGRSDGYLAPRYIEFGNETNESYQFGGVSSGPSYVSRAQQYALRAKDAATAIAAANNGVGLLLQADNGGCGCSQWVDGMFSSVPDLNTRIAGWTAHPYGPQGRYRPILDQLLRDVAKHGDTSLPIFITEFGISTNNGACVSGNMGWPTCLTYQQAADSMHNSIADMHYTYGTRIAQLYMFEERDMGGSNSQQANYGFLKTDGSPKGAYTDEAKRELATYVG